MPAQPMAIRSGAAVEYEHSLMNFLTPIIRVTDPVTGKKAEESSVGWWSSVDNFAVDTSIFTPLYPLGVIVDAINSYNIPREILSTRADYEMPPYHNEHERMALSPNGIYPGNEYVGMPLENIEYGGSINWKKFTKDFEKFLKQQKKEIKNNYKASYEVEIWN